MMLSVIASGLAGYSRKLELVFMLRQVSNDITNSYWLSWASDWLETFESQFLMMFASEIAFGAFISYSMEILGPRYVFMFKLRPCCEYHFENNFLAVDHGLASLRILPVHLEWSYVLFLLILSPIGSHGINRPVIFMQPSAIFELPSSTTDTYKPIVGNYGLLILIESY